MTNLLEGLMQHTGFLLYSLHRGKRYLFYLPFPPKLLRSPTFLREGVGLSMWERERECMQDQCFYVHLRQIFLCVYINILLVLVWNKFKCLCTLNADEY